jgi:uncharacterized protein (DUF1015 family)
MPELEPLRALHYNLERTGGLQAVIAPPYDVIDERQREELEARSPYNVVRIDLPRGNGDRYENAARQLAEWERENVIVRDSEEAVWLLAQEYTGPDQVNRIRHGILGRVRIEEYGPGRIRAHERTHPGPKEDRLRLTRATRADLSPIFALYDDQEGVVSSSFERFISEPCFGEATEADGTVDRLWRIADGELISIIAEALRPTELLIADGHHRYETARQYAEEVGGEGPHRYVLMCLVALDDPGLTVFPTHRLVRGLSPDKYETLAYALRDNFNVSALTDTSELEPEATGEVRLGYIDSHFKRPYRLTLKSQELADAALPDHAEPYRRLDTAVLEAMVLKGTLGMSDEQIDHLEGLRYARDAKEAVALVERGDYDVGFFMAPAPIEQVRAIAAAGENMPPKSTYFFPKVPTGLVFNPLSE